MKNEPLSLDILLNIFFLWVNIFLFDFWNFLTILTENKRGPTRLLLECRQSLFYIKHLDDFQKMTFIIFSFKKFKNFPPWEKCLKHDYFKHSGVLKP